MKVLLDTHLLLWAAFQSRDVPPAARSLLEDATVELFVSVATIWEVAIKRSRGRKDFLVDARILRRGLLDNGYKELAITSEHAVFVENLPPIHKDPFDRILIAQATVEGMTLLTSDAVLAQYPGPVKLV